MIESLPAGINTLFVATFLATVFLFYWSTRKNLKILIGLLIWSAIHAVLAYSDFYTNGEAIPPPFALVLLPAIAIIVWGLTGSRKQHMLKNREPISGTLMHVVRVPVEICLYYLFVHQAVPELMTFAGRNYDIIVGFMAPLAALAIKLNKFSARFWRIWNLFGLFMVSFILINGLLSAPLPFQQFAFDQPNIAVMYFPFVLLPATIVPLVVYSHLLDFIYWSKK